MMSVVVSLLLTRRTWARSRAALQLEMLALRHQLQVLQRTRRRRLRLTNADRWLWVRLSGIWTGWPPALVIVKPETLIAWHRRSFRLWVDRQGKETPVNAPVRAFEVARISPDGNQAAVDIRDRGNDIWVWDFRRETLARLTSTPSSDISPVWTPDGRRLLWSSVSDLGVPNLYWQASDGTGKPERLTTTGNPQFVTTISKDGLRALLFEGPTGTVPWEIRSLSLPHGPNDSAGSQRPTEPLVRAPGVNFQNAEISADGNWVAYESNKSKQYEIYVSPFPKVDDGLWLISSAGGTRPAWSRDGKELFFLDANNLLTVVPVQTDGSAFRAGNPRKLLNTAYYPGYTTRGYDLRGYDISPDGQRFLMIKENAPAGQDQQTTGASSPSMVVVINWQEELKRLAPTK